MSCPRPGGKCKEFSCGSSIDGMCAYRMPTPPRVPLRKVGTFTEEAINLANFKASVENIANMYAKIVENQLKDKKSIEELPEINEGIRLLNYIANTIERIDRLKN